MKDYDEIKAEFMRLPQKELGLEGFCVDSDGEQTRVGLQINGELHWAPLDAIVDILQAAKDGAETSADIEPRAISAAEMVFRSRGGGELEIIAPCRGKYVFNGYETFRMIINLGVTFDPIGTDTADVIMGRGIKDYLERHRNPKLRALAVELDAVVNKIAAEIVRPGRPAN